MLAMPDSNYPSRLLNFAFIADVYLSFPAPGFRDISEGNSAVRMCVEISNVQETTQDAVWATVSSMDNTAIGREYPLGTGIYYHLGV